MMKSMLMVVACLVSLYAWADGPKTDEQLIDEAMARLPSLPPSFMPVKINGEDGVWCLSKATSKKIGGKQFVYGVPVADESGKFDCRNYMPGED